MAELAINCIALSVQLWLSRSRHSPDEMLSSSNCKRIHGMIDLSISLQYKEDEFLVPSGIEA
jgi:hypothetical protein